MLKSAHIDKVDFGIEHSIMIGDEGGLYMLLNSINEEDKKIIIDSGQIHEGFLEDKIAKTKKKNKKGIDKVVIGSGGFGIVKFALTLTSSGALEAGKLICIKKTKKDEFDKERILNITLGDYFIDDVGNYVYAPKVYDMGITYKINEMSK